MRDKHVVIIGGGLAGMAAASALAPLGVRITLLESRNRLGGRASSFIDKATGLQIDNCQHVSLGCCTNFQRFCRAVGIDSFFHPEPELTFIGRDNHQNRFSASWLPAPLHLAGAFSRLSYLAFHDRWRLAWGLRALAHARGGKLQQDMASWLREQRQTPATITRVWEVVLVSALSESLERITVASARKVFVDAFLANRQGWVMSVPTRPLDELYEQHVTTCLKQHGVEIRLHAGVAQIQEEQGKVEGVRLRSGEILQADEVVVTVPAYHLTDLLPEAWRAGFTNLEQIEWAPISSVHIWLDREMTPLRHAVLVDRLSQWIFNRTAITGDTAQGHAYQVVISASRQLAGRASTDVIAEVIEELRQTFPIAREAAVLHSRLVTERRAAMSMSPGVDALRPSQRTEYPGLTLAGDWTQTGWPSTMEGAVRSGYLAAEALMDRWQLPQRFVQPDLPVSPSARWLLGLR